MYVDICGVPHIVSHLQLVLLRPPVSCQAKTFMAFYPAGWSVAGAVEVSAAVV